VKGKTWSETCQAVLKTRDTRLRYRTVEFIMLFSDDGSVHFESDFMVERGLLSNHVSSSRCEWTNCWRELVGGEGGRQRLANSDLAGQSLISGADCNNPRTRLQLSKEQHYTRTCVRRIWELKVSCKVLQIRVGTTVLLTVFLTGVIVGDSYQIPHQKNNTSE
jgi:hypothetical protein